MAVGVCARWVGVIESTGQRGSSLSSTSCHGDRRTTRGQTKIPPARDEWDRIDLLASVCGTKSGERAVGQRRLGRDRRPALRRRLFVHLRDRPSFMDGRPAQRPTHSVRRTVQRDLRSTHTKRACNPAYANEERAGSGACDDARAGISETSTRPGLEYAHESGPT